jgi:integrase family protein with SAM-like domain
MHLAATQRKRYDLRNMPRFQIVRRIVRDHGYQYEAIWVEGRSANGERIRKRFRTEEAARTWKSLREIQSLNEHSEFYPVVTKLTQEQIAEAENAFRRLGTRYSLTSGIEFFLKNYCEPDVVVSIEEAAAQFLEAKARQIRDRSCLQLKSTITQFKEFAGNCHVHEVTQQMVEQFLRSLRAKDGNTPAAKRTWNNYRSDLHNFFAWCANPQRRWVGVNPASDIPKQKTGRDIPQTLSVEEARELMGYVAEYKGGILAKYFALSLFAGLRTGNDGELQKLARHADRSKLIDLNNGVIHVRPEISKTHDYRQIIIRDNLRAWLTTFPGDILPKNFEYEIKGVRKKFSLSQDVLRHTFFSMHVAAFKSVGEAALEGGNTEAVIKKHYLNLSSYKDGAGFWKIAPADQDRKVIHLVGQT